MAKVLELKSLTFVRQAYAVSAADFFGSDHDRPLTAKGVEAAKNLNKALADTLSNIDIIIMSDALRVTETFKHLTNTSKNAEVRIVEEIYDCSAGHLYNIILDNQDGFNNMMIIGHNPALSQLYSMLSGEYTALAPAQSRTLIMQ